jgi:hypothetical protein
MRKFNPSFAALAVACVALFAALGGTSVAASLLIGTNQPKDGAVTSSKIGHRQARSGNLALGAVNARAALSALSRCGRTCRLRPAPKIWVSELVRQLPVARALVS